MKIATQLLQVMKPKWSLQNMNMSRIWMRGTWVDMIVLDFAQTRTTLRMLASNTDMSTHHDNIKNIGGDKVKCTAQ